MLHGLHVTVRYRRRCATVLQYSEMYGSRAARMPRVEKVMILTLTLALS